jgi:hypothetical protein
MEAAVTISPRRPRRNHAPRHRQNAFRPIGVAEGKARTRSHQSRDFGAEAWRGFGFARTRRRSAEDWTEQVYKPDIVSKAETIYKKPGYNPL